MRGVREFIGRHVLWLAMGALLAALALLLVFQYGWLTRLEHTSAVAHRATLGNYLSAVATRVEYFYRKDAERALNPPASLIKYNRIPKLAYHFAKREVPGAKRLFVLDLTSERGSRLWFYDGFGPAMLPPDELSDETRAVYVALAPWKLVAKKDASLERTTLSVDERDPLNRIIMNPITDDDLRLVAVVGYVVDEAYFLSTVLAEAIAEAVPAGARQELVITAHDATDRVVLASGEQQMATEQVSQGFGFLFRDWRLGLASSAESPEQWARSNFRFNMTLAAVLAAVLVVIILWTLRVASRELKLSQMKSDFVSNVSHELRTPLASIRVFGEFLRLGRVSSEEKIREYGEYIETESRRLTQLINNILDFSRIESHRKTYRFEHGDLEEVVRQVVASFDIQVKMSGFDLKVEVENGPLPPVMLDAEALALAIHNLIDNAIKYSGEAREVRLTLTWQAGRVRLDVSDRGIGISSDDQGRVFERFQRVGSSLVYDVRGSGLGLAIVKHIVGAHGGTVGVESQPDAGSTFSVELPVARAGAAAALPRGAPIEGAQP